MKKLNLKSKLKKTANVLAGIFTFAAVAGGISALATTVVNPVDLWWSIAPIEIAYFNYINRVADGLGLEPEQFIDEKGYKTK